MPERSSDTLDNLIVGLLIALGMLLGHAIASIFF
jgi:hypothetical protein